jgi:hypothetical protein
MLDATRHIEISNSEVPTVKVGSLSDFRGGMLTAVDPLKLAEDQYYLLINGRTRFGNIEPIKKPKDITSSAQFGVYQGLYAVGSSLIIFVNGVAYFRDVATTSATFTRIRTFERMEHTVDRIYAESIPSSYNNLSRKSQDGSSDGDIFRSDLKTGSPSTLICQDGVSRPRLIFPNKTSRIANDDSRWTQDNREYVPSGKQMLYKDGILYIVSKDGTELYRSLEGRPLDFVIAVDPDGNKLPLEDFKEEAQRLSHKVSFDRITAIGNLNVPPTIQGIASAFLVTSEKFSWMVIPNYDKTVYGEPTFRNVDLFPTGPLNQFSIVNILGDTVFVDYAGLKSFNAIAQFTSDGQNSPFSKDVHSIFKDRVQDNPSAIVYDNYAFFGVKTVYGNANLVYDELLQKFVSIDIFSGVQGNIIQYAEIKANGIRKLYFITDANRLYEAFASDEVETCELYTKEWASGDTKLEQIPQRINLSFINIKAPGGRVSVTEFVDRKSGTLKQKQILGGNVDSMVDIIDIPFGVSTEETTKNVTFKLDDSKRGFKAGIKISFNFQAELNLIELRSKLITSNVSKREQVEIFNT